MSGFAVYTAAEVSILVGGVDISDLMGADEFVRIEKAEDDVAYEASADGGGTLNVLRSTEHTVTIVTKHVSPATKVLSGIHAAGRLLSQGILIVPVIIVDRGSKGNLFATDKAWMKKLADEGYGRQAQDIEWAFGAHDPARFIAGH